VFVLADGANAGGFCYACWVMVLFSSRLARPRSAYVHIPFCVHRCGYCNFSVVTGREDLVEPLLSALEIELGGLEEPQEVETLYFGGGTPTFLSPAQLERLCKIVLRWHPLAEGYEWTVEANPGDLDQARLEVLSRFGVNRLSLGVQSFRPEKLKLLERDHRANEIYESVRLAREAGMRVSLDLIFAAPGESLAEWQTDIDEGGAEPAARASIDLRADFRERDYILESARRGRALKRFGRAGARDVFGGDRSAQRGGF